MPGSVTQQLNDLERQLYDARQQLTMLRRNVHVRAEAVQPKEHNLRRRNTPSEDACLRTSVEITRKSCRIATRRQLSLRESAHSSSKDVDGGPAAMDADASCSISADGLLLAVDKFLSTAHK